MVRAYRRVPPYQSGLTLLECLVSIAIIAIMLAMALPSFRDQLATARAKAAALQLYAAMQFARTKAQMEGISVILCPIHRIGAHRLPQLMTADAVETLFGFIRQQLQTPLQIFELSDSHQKRFN